MFAVEQMPYRFPSLHGVSHSKSEHLRLPSDQRIKLHNDKLTGNIKYFFRELMKEANTLGDQDAVILRKQNQIPTLT